MAGSVTSESAAPWTQLRRRCYREARRAERLEGAVPVHLVGICESVMLLGFHGAQVREVRFIGDKSL